MRQDVMSGWMGDKEATRWEGWSQPLVAEKNTGQSWSRGQVRLRRPTRDLLGWQQHPQNVPEGDVQASGPKLKKAQHLLPGDSRAAVGLWLLGRDMTWKFSLVSCHNSGTISGLWSKATRATILSPFPLLSISQCSQSTVR